MPTFRLMQKPNLETTMPDLFEPAVDESKLGTLIDQLADLRRDKKELEKVLTGIEEEISNIEDDIIHMMSEQGLERAAHNGVSVTPKQHTYAHVEDWARFYDFIDKNKYWHLLEKRVSVTGYRELIELGRDVPGVVPFVKTKLSVTKSLR